MEGRAQRELEESERLVNSLFSQINTNTTDQEEINGILKELDYIGEGERIVHLVGPVLVKERKEEVRMELKDKLASLQREEAELRTQLNEERERHDHLQSKAISNGYSYR
ncbi:hypothetical protein WA556_002163 [Blastocystis sp. ATCC 50177/Nand II]